jgi:hypothetical protein|tara:strand:- start:47 stop:280 length:234 start_codon:yes stop_codon:yes gene_type:complete
MREIMSIKSVSDKMSQAYVLGADDAKKQARQELEALRELCDDQARIIESMQKQLDIAHRVEFAKRRAPRDASRNFSG